jgi:hypothetical protein
MRNWAERTKASGALLADDGFVQHETPNEQECETYGQKLADF